MQWTCCDSNRLALCYVISVAVVSCFMQVIINSVESLIERYFAFRFSGVFWTEPDQRLPSCFAANVVRVSEMPPVIASWLFVPASFTEVINLYLMLGPDH